MYADDIVQCGDTVGQLRSHIRVLEQYCSSWGMKVNLKKTKIMVFRRGGPLKNNEQWFFDKTKIDVVSEYKYLGLVFSTTLSWSRAQLTLAIQAQKALLKLHRLDKMCDGLPPQLQFELFDRTISPILCYGSEIWGFNYSDIIETVHTKFCKRVLGVNKFTSNAAVLGDCGRYSLSVTYYKRCIKYWLKIIQTPDGRYIKECYRVLKELDDFGRKTWATNVRTLLYRYGFGHVWFAQGVGQNDLFIQKFVQRIKDCYIQDWHSEITNSDKLNTYRIIKNLEFGMELYLKELKHKKFRAVVAQLRCSSHKLAIETGRHEGVPRVDRICVYCQNIFNENFIENEEHFI